jgi:hypothetical protein
MSERTIWEELAAPFAEGELEWKPQTIGKKGDRIYALLVPYVQSRAIMDRLDKAVGPENWTTELRPVCIKGEEGFVCKLSIRVDDETADGWEWASREDVAPASDIEAMKGAASGALKRVAVQFGIGRYLYGLPQYWANDIKNGHAPADVADAVRLYSKKDEIDAWCHAPKIGLQKAQESPKEARPAKSKPEPAPDTPDYGNIPPGEPYLPEDEQTSPKTKTTKVPKDGNLGKVVKVMKSQLGPATCFFCGDKHVQKGEEIVGVEGLTGKSKAQWGATECYDKWCKEASHAA